MVMGITGLGTTANPIPLDYASLRAAPDLVIDQYVADNLYFRTRNRYPFVAFAELLSRSGQQNYTVNGKVVNWFIGDEEPTVATLGDTYTPPATTVTMSADFNYFVIGTVLQLRQVIAGIPYVCELRITSAPTTLAGPLYQYNVEMIRCQDEMTLAAATPTFTTGATVLLQSHFAPWDGEAGEYIQRRPVSIYNILQRSRECVGEGKWQMAETFYTDIRLMRQAQDKMYNMLTKIDKQMLTQAFRVGPGTLTGTGYNNSLEGAQFAGLPFYLQPGCYNNGYGPTSTDVANGTAPYVGLRGQIYCADSVEYTYDKLNDFGAHMTRFGGDLKVCVASPTNIIRIKAALNGVSGLRFYTEKFMFPGTTSIWEMDAVQLDTMRLAFLPDHNLDNVPLFVRGPDPENGGDWNNVGAITKFAYFIDPKHIGVAYLNVPGEGVSRMRLYDVEATNRSSIIRKEIEVGMSLVVSEVRAHGVLALSM